MEYLLCKPNNIVGIFVVQKKHPVISWKTNKTNKRSIPLGVHVACNVTENNFYQVLAQTKSFVHSNKRLIDKPGSKYGFVTKTPKWTSFIL
jgi:hypothetical protein